MFMKYFFYSNFLMIPEHIVAFKIGLKIGAEVFVLKSLNKILKPKTWVPFKSALTVELKCDKM